MGQMIFDEKAQVFKIDTEHTSYAMGVLGGTYLVHLYYGKRLQSADLGYLLDFDEELKDVPLVEGQKIALLERLPLEYSFDGVGDFRQGCLEVTNQDGFSGVELVYDSYEILPEKRGLPGLPATFGDKGETLCITLKDDCLGLRVKLSYSIFADNDALIRSVEVINAGEEILYLNKVLSSCLDMERCDFDTLTLPGAWGRERHFDRSPLGYGRMANESVRGVSSHQNQPFMALLSKDCTQEQGEVFAMHFVYSGNFLAAAEKSQFDMTRLVMGIHPKNFTWQLKPGERFQAPEVVQVYSSQGLDGMTHTLHGLYREHLLPRKWVYKERPVLINNWEGTYFDFDEEKLFAIAEEASKHGIELFVMDDGWFGKRDHDACSLGDWQVNESKLKGGLGKLVERINGLGMKFGIWFEPEMVSPDSDIYRAHPDWAIQIPGRKPTQSRSQLVFDLSRDEVVEYVYESVAEILRSANIEYVKWDMNRLLTDLGGAGLPAERRGELSHRYMLAVYELQRRLTEEFPELLLENCSSGGARFDPGMLYYSPQIWCSDDTDAIERLAIQEGTQLLYPLSVTGAHVSDCPNHAVGRSTPFETRAVVAMAGTFGYELDITRIAEEERSQIAAQVKRYKQYAGLVQRGEYYRLASYQQNHLYDCYEIVSEDKSQVMVVFVQVLGEANLHSHCIRLKGLEPRRMYQWKGHSYSGEVLMQAGLVVRRPWGDFTSEVIVLEGC